MQFKLLGNLEVWCGTARVSLGGLREQRILAVQLLHANRVVPVERLVDALWDEDPPATAVKQVRNAVSRLRALFASSAHVIVADGGGYRIAVADDELDTQVFELAVAQARAAAEAGDLAAATERLSEALGLWRGPALTGLGGRVIEAAAAVWNERRVAAEESYFEYAITLGHHGDVVADLSALVAEHPLREKLLGQLMLVLHRCGRQADALALYSDARARLIAELGLEPSTELRALHHRILADDPAVSAPAPSPSAKTRTELVVPHQLPAALRHFVGRVGPLKFLREILDQEVGPGGTVVISAIAGTAGIGKTTLALHWAHQVAERFPGGQLYVNLRGFDPSGAPMAPAEAVRGFLSALGVSEPPSGTDAQLALYRDMLAGRRMLIVLDNARDAEQVRPLLPANPTCLVLITSRQHLTALTVVEGAHPLTLELLSRAEGHDLLNRRLGVERTASESGAAAELIELCAGLPLALSVAAAHAAHTVLPLSHVVGQLRDSRSRLDVLRTGDPTTDVRAVLSWSRSQLDPAAARMFHLLGLAPGPETSTAAAASLAGVDSAQARRVLADLVRANLLSPLPSARYTFHDLLRAYAAEEALRHESDQERRSALHRVLDHYLHMAYSADRLLHPARDPVDLPPPLPEVTLRRLPDTGSAQLWFERECPVLLASVKVAFDAGFYRHTWGLAWSLATFLQRHGRWDDLVTTQCSALRAADRTHDRVGQVHTHRTLGRTYARLGRYADADAHVGRALELSLLGGDLVGRARAFIDRAWTLELRERYDEALHAARDALALFTETGHRIGRAGALNVVGWYLAMLGEYQYALTYCEQALDLLRDLGDRHAEAGTLDSLGYIHDRLGDHHLAQTRYRQAIELFNELGDRVYEAGSVVRLGDAQLAAGDIEAARAAWRQALIALEELRHPDAAQVRAKLLDQGP